MVSCLSSAWAIAILVPTPSVEVASSGRAYCFANDEVEEPGEAADAAEHVRARGSRRPPPS